MFGVNIGYIILVMYILIAIQTFRRSLYFFYDKYPLDTDNVAQAFAAGLFWFLYWPIVFGDVIQDNPRLFWSEPRSVKRERKNEENLKGMTERAKKAEARSKELEEQLGGKDGWIK
jgi:hypothetical protein